MFDAFQNEKIRIVAEKYHRKWHDWTPGIPFVEMVANTGDGRTIRPGLEAILSAMLTWGFMALESLANDVWLEVVNRGDKRFAECVLGQPLSATREDFKSLNVQAKSISIGELGRYGYDLRDKMGQILKDQGKVHFESMNNVKKAYEAAFEKLAETCFTPNDFRLVRLLESIRNLYAHRGGIVDPKFRDEVEDLPRFADLPAGRLPINGSLCSELLGAVVRTAKSLLLFGDERLAGNGA